jgi:general secretion pathway protein C
MIALKAGARAREARSRRLLVAAELTLLALIAVQFARLLYAAIVPPGPVGAWTVGAPAPPPQSLLDAVAVATADLTLAGVRLDRATGRGSAILGPPGQPQQVFRVGEEVAPGVRLTGVAFDHVTLDQGGRAAQLFMDQSAPAAPGVPAAAALAPAPAPPAMAAAARELMQDVEAVPRLEGGVVTGYALEPSGAGERFRALGLQPGDVLVAVDGRPVQALGAGDLQAIGSEGAVLQVERNGQRVSLRARP